MTQASELPPCPECPKTEVGLVSRMSIERRSTVTETPEEALAVLTSWQHELEASGYRVSYANLGWSEYGPPGWGAAIEAMWDANDGQDGLTVVK